MTRLDAPATGRNRGPILEILARWLGPRASAARVVDAAADCTCSRSRAERGSTRSASREALRHLRWQPSDVDRGLSRLDRSLARRGASPERRRADPARRARRGLGRRPVDVIFNANMIHIAPWSVAEGLFAGAGRILVEGGLLFLYGPFRVGGRHTAESNEAFDADLRRRNPEWGVRDLERVVETAAGAGLQLLETNDMPANNKLLVFRAGDGCADLRAINPISAAAWLPDARLRRDCPCATYNSCRACPRCRRRSGWRARSASVSACRLRKSWSIKAAMIWMKPGASWSRLSCIGHFGASVFEELEDPARHARDHRIADEGGDERVVIDPGRVRVRDRDPACAPAPRGARAGSACARRRRST